MSKHAVPVGQGPVRRLPRAKAAIATERVARSRSAQKGECRACQRLTNNRIEVNVVIGRVWVRLCSRCIQKFKTGVKFLQDVSKNI